MAPKHAASEFRHVVSINDFSREQLVRVLEVASKLEHVRDDRLKGRILATLFFEPSTRTRLSLEAAMTQLGGSAIGFADAHVSSAKKGETLYDTIRVLTQYADVIAIRHPLEGAARVAAEASSVPVINGGDGSNQHPTQTFIDLFTMAKAHPGLLDGSKEFTVALLGDLRYGRTIHSLIMALAYFRVRFRLISPPSLRLGDEYLELLSARGIPFEQGERLDEAVSGVDILYVTRIQEERFPDPVEYMRVRNSYQVRAESLGGAKSGFIVMHPLPRVNEIDRSVDDLKVTAYFAQAGYGIPVRKAVLCLVLGRL